MIKYILVSYIVLIKLCAINTTDGFIDRNMYEVKQNIDNNEACYVNNFKFFDNLNIYAGGASSGREIGFSINSKKYKTTQYEVIVNVPNEEVALLLVSGTPSIWNIHWTEKTKIKAVFTTGSFRQVITGLPENIPILSSVEEDDDHQCYLSYISSDESEEANHLPGSFDRTQTSLDKVNSFSMKIYGKKVENIFYAKKGNLVIGNKVSRRTKLYTSKKNQPEHYYKEVSIIDENKKIKEYLKKRLIRMATEEDFKQWSKKRYLLFRKKIIRSNEKEIVINTNIIEKDFKSSESKRIFHNTYMILKKISLPIGSSSNWFVKKGVPFPDGKIKKNTTVYDFNSMTCRGLHYCE